jgi:hypothetical protein
MPLPLSLFLTVTREDGIRNRIYRFCIGLSPSGEDLFTIYHQGRLILNPPTAHVGSYRYRRSIRTIHPTQRNAVLLLHWSTRDFYRLVILTNLYDIEICDREHWVSFHFAMQPDLVERLVSVGPLYRLRGHREPLAYIYGHGLIRERFN